MSERTFLRVAWLGFVPASPVIGVGLGYLVVHHPVLALVAISALLFALGWLVTKVAAR